MLLFASGFITAEESYTIQYNHQFSWNDEGIRMSIQVTGPVQFRAASNHAIKWNQPNHQGEPLNVVYRFMGESTVQAKGTGRMQGEGDSVTLSFEVPVKVKLTGKSWFKPAPDNPGEFVELWNFQLDEDWTSHISWKVESSEPEAIPYIMAALPKNFQNPVPEQPRKTLQFQRHPYHRPQTLEAQAFQNMGVPMKGTISYTFIVPNQGVTTAPKDQNRYDEEYIIPDRDYHFPAAGWGPPLEEIVWDEVNLD